MRLPRLPALVVAAVALLLAVAATAHAAEQILSFNSAVTVRVDGVLEVTETIRVRAEGAEIKRGIYRDFPLTFEDENGRSHRVSFDLVEVLRDGKPEPHHTNANASGVRIYLGKEDVLLRPGEYTYTLRYETGRQIRFLPDHTELFWNVTGNEWNFPILRATAIIHLPQGRAPVRWTAYTGSYGERGDDFTGDIRGDNALAVTTTRTLGPGEGLSVVVEVPEGLVAEPSGSQTFNYWFLDYKRYVIGGIGLAVLLVFYLITWSAVGRDPPKGVIIPLFHPPAGVSPALASYVHDWGWSGNGWRAFTAAILSLAVKGLLIFDDSGEDLVLTRTEAKVGFRDLPPGERAVLVWLESRPRKSIAINTGTGASVATALTTFKNAVEAENRNRFFKRNAGFFAVGIGLTILTVIAVLAFGDLTDGEVALLFFIGFASVFLGAFIVPLLRALQTRSTVKSFMAIALNIVIVLYIGGTFASIAFSGFSSLPDDFGRSLFTTVLNNAFPFALVGGLATMNGLFYYLLRAPTAAGRKIMDQIEGLDLYIRTAETDRLNAQGAPDLDATQFERILPYAIALKAEKPWSEAFETAFARANPGQDATAAYTPAWHGGHGWIGGRLGSSMASTVSSATGSFASSIPAPKSSSSGFSSGGGGSGGGGGGGGGGGW